MGVKLYNNGIVDKFKALNPLKLITMEKFDDAELMNLDRVGILNCTASSHLTTQEGNYEPILCIDSNAHTCWQEGDSGNGEGESLTFSFTQEENISAISIFNGKHTDPDSYLNNTRAKQIVVKIGYKRYFIKLEDIMQRQTFAFKSPQKAKDVTITVFSVYPGNMWEDLCMSEIEFYKEK